MSDTNSYVITCNVFVIEVKNEKLCLWVHVLILLESQTLSGMFLESPQVYMCVYDDFLR